LQRRYNVTGIYSSRDAFYCALQATTAKQSSQQPEYEPGRRTIHFPFAVKI
jgi:hypothetical protein